MACLDLGRASSLQYTLSLTHSGHLAVAALRGVVPPLLGVSLLVVVEVAGRW